MRVIAGPEKKTRVMSREGAPDHRLPRDGPRDRRPLAAEHATRCTRSRSSAAARRSATRSRCRPRTSSSPRARSCSDTMAMTLGGRAAEEIVFGEITTGASNDLEKVTETAKQMVMRFGMSERLGPRVFGHDRGHALPRPRVLRRARLLRRDRARDRRRDPPHRRGGAPDRQGHPRRAPRGPRPDLRRSCSSARRSTPSSSSTLLEGKPEEEVFGRRRDADPGDPAADARGAASAKPERAPKPLPRPGLAGGTAEMRSDPPPEKP